MGLYHNYIYSPSVPRMPCNTWSLVGEGQGRVIPFIPDSTRLGMQEFIAAHGTMRLSQLEVG